MQELLNARFRAPLKDFYKRRILVWLDEEGGYRDTIAEMQLENAVILTMEENRMFELRRQIEVDHAEENILLYCPLKFEKPEDNWLLDVFFYSEVFQADYWSQLFEELHITMNHDMREYAKSLGKFFESKERKARLRALRESYTCVQELQTGVFCVQCCVKQCSMDAALIALLSADDEGKLYSEAIKYTGEEAFWQTMKKEYGYAGEQSISLLQSYLLTSAALLHAEQVEIPGMEINAAYASRAYALVAAWYQKNQEEFLNACFRTEETTGMERRLEKINTEKLLKMGVYPAVDRVMIKRQLDAFAGQNFNTDEAALMLKEREDHLWQERYEAYHQVLQTLILMRLFEQAHHSGFHAGTLVQAWKQYSDDWYTMDQYYRSFCSAYEKALNAGIMALEDALNNAAGAADRLYKNWFLCGVNELWSNLLDHETLEDAVPKHMQQAMFYEKYVAVEDVRTFVVISDGLRYEVGKALTEKINGKMTGNAECMPMMATYPTVTSVGMAALLPHNVLSMGDDWQILCDGMNTTAAERHKILSAKQPDSAVITYTAFRQMTKAQRAEFVKGKKVVYIYHYAIDQAGENGMTVMSACDTAVAELLQLMHILTTERDASRVLITADHGFLYTRLPLDECDKAGKEQLARDVVAYKRRYAIAQNGEPGDGVLAISLNNLHRPDLTAMFPRGCMRFRIQGSSNPYMHGGVALQELMTPLIQYQGKKAGQKGYQAITKTDILLLGENRMISNNLFSLSFHQTEACGGKVQPRIVIARFEDAQGRVISDEHRWTANSIAQEKNERVKRVSFRLLGNGYDKYTDYYLILIDAEEKAVMQKIPFRINIVFGLEFDF